MVLNRTGLNFTNTNPIIISTLKEFYFPGTRGSLGEKHAHMFSSSIEEGPGSNELEIPLPMLAIVATTLHSALDDWASGERKPTDFNAERYEDVYNAHVTTLKTIQKKKLKYHRLMSNLYNAASSKASIRSTNMARNAIALLNLDAMEE
ncbi:hypothetical protein LshimejAT787_2500470 [Lyophyllum shimeji]|uniref:DUF6532 domain-containing protein n=1 Tax=Lyophyllum shimeji TaxID=47721 RepID=A0A9P3UV98_LYOSH|nr:hypothetical protein LshimejAT787_2500470 [Lyophyllum shimeji]